MVIDMDDYDYTHTKMTVIKDRKPTLEELQKLVHGWIEIVTLGDGTQLICNEEGKIYSHPLNEKATKIAHETGVLLDDWLVGDIVHLKGKARI